jgi:hypothetical protein
LVIIFIYALQNEKGKLFSVGLENAAHQGPHAAGHF